MKNFFRLHTFLVKGPDRRETMAYLAQGQRYIVAHSPKLRNREQRRFDAVRAQRHFQHELLRK